MPGAVMGLVADDELVLHGWDLAVATGQPFDVAPANLEAAWQLVRQTPDDPAAREGLFGPALPADAPLLDRVLGAAGRDPHWTACSELPADATRRSDHRSGDATPGPPQRRRDLRTAEVTVRAAAVP